MNTTFTNLNVRGPFMELARDTDRHVKKTLPPTLSGFPGEAEIRYFVKVTVQRAAFFKENYRAVRSSYVETRAIELKLFTALRLQVLSYRAPAPSP